MKYRIVKNGLDEYYVQRKKWGLFWADYNERVGMETYMPRYFKTWRDAAVYVRHLKSSAVNQIRNEEARKDIKIIEYL